MTERRGWQRGDVSSEEKVVERRRLQERYISKEMLAMGICQTETNEVSLFESERERINRSVEYLALF